MLNVSPSAIMGWEEKNQSLNKEGLVLKSITKTQKMIIEAVLEMPVDRQKALAEVLGLSE